MNHRLHPSPTTALARGQMLRLHDKCGRGIAVISGLAWVTQDGDARDVVLGPGQSFVLDRPGLALVNALRDSALIVFDAAPQQQPREPAGSLLSFLRLSRA